MAASQDLSELENDPRLYLYTSLTAGSSHIITATSRLETILKANKIPFLAIDTATDEKCRKLWGRRAGKRKLPGLVKEGFVIGDLEEIEEWNEFGELKENIGPVPPTGAAPSTSEAKPAPIPLPVNPTATQGTANIRTKPGQAPKGPPQLVDHSKIRPLPDQAPSATSSLEAADEATQPETMNSSSAAKTESIQIAEANATETSDALQSPRSPALTSDPNLTVAEGIAGQTHRGSNVSDAPAEEIQSVEKANAIPEAEEEDESLSKGVEGLQTGEGEKTQEQGAKEADKAGESVED